MRLPAFLAVFFLFAPVTAAYADTVSVFTITGASQFYNGSGQNTISGTTTIDTTTGLVESLSFIAGGIGQSGVSSQSGTDLYVGVGDLHFTISGNTLVGFQGDNFNLVMPDDQYVGQVIYDGPDDSPDAASTAVTPEPKSLLLLGTGLLGICAMGRRQYAMGR